MIKIEVRIMSTLTEREIALAEAIIIPSLIAQQLDHQDQLQLSTFLKVLLKYIEKTSPASAEHLLQQIHLEDDITVQQLQQYFQLILVHQINIATDPTISNKKYTTGDIARFFGVSVATINNWIHKGRIVGVEKGERFKQARIPEDAIYLSTTGENITIKEASELYQTELERTSLRPTTAIEEMKELIDAIYHYEQKYNGTYEEVVVTHTTMTSQQQRDFTEWQQLLRTLQDVKR